MMQNMWEQSLSIVNVIGSGAICADGPQSAKLQIFTILGSEEHGGGQVQAQPSHEMHMSMPSRIGRSFGL
jgi:hypothetical protein